MPTPSETCVRCGIVEENGLDTHASPLGRLCTECYDTLKAEHGWGPRLKSWREIEGEFARGEVKVEVLGPDDIEVERTEDGGAIIRFRQEGEDG